MYSQKIAKGVLIILSFVSSTLVRQPRTISVCDIVSNPRNYDGKVVTIRGQFVASVGDTFDELAPLQAEQCPREVRYRNIGVKSPDVHFLSDPPKGWKADEASFDLANKTIDSLLEKDPKLRRVLVTVEGAVLYGGERPQAKVLRDPWYPAWIVISAFKDIRKT